MMKSVRNQNKNQLANKRARELSEEDVEEMEAEAVDVTMTVEGEPNGKVGAVQEMNEVDTKKRK